MGCAAQLDTGVMAFITRLWPRRIEVVDERKGLVVTFVMFNHRGGFKDLPIKGVPGVTSLSLDGASSTMQMAELFKIRGGKIHEVEAIGFAQPYGAKSGWNNYRRHLVADATITIATRAPRASGNCRALEPPITSLVGQVVERLECFAGHPVGDRRRAQRRGPPPVCWRWRFWLGAWGRRRPTPAQPTPA